MPVSTDFHLPEIVSGDAAQYRNVPCNPDIHTTEHSHLFVLHKFIHNFLYSYYTILCYIHMLSFWA